MAKTKEEIRKIIDELGEKFTKNTMSYEELDSFCGQDMVLTHRAVGMGWDEIIFPRGNFSQEERDRINKLNNDQREEVYIAYILGSIMGGMNIHDYVIYFLDKKGIK